MLRMFNNNNENFSIDSTKQQLIINDKIVSKKYSFDKIFSSDVSQVNNQFNDKIT